MHATAEAPSEIPQREGATNGPIGFAVGVALAAAIWLITEPIALTAAWLAFGAWTVWRGRRAQNPRLPLLALVGSAMGGVVLLAPDLPQPALGLCLVIGAGVAPAHLWLESLRRSLSRSDFALVLVAQPFVALLHGFIVSSPHALSAGTLDVLQVVFVASAVVQAGLGLVRSTPERVLGAVVQSQSALVLAGAASGDSGWSAAQMMLVSLTGSSLVLASILAELRRRFGELHTWAHHALADEAPELHRLFLVCGWIFVGLPGGLAFFAEDLLFHAFVAKSVAATAGFIVAAALNAIAFYRVYLSLFSGPEQQRTEHPPAAPTARWKVVALTAIVLVLLALGLAPGLLLGSHGA